MVDILGRVFEVVSGLEMPPAARIYLLTELGAIEYQLSVGTSEKIQLAAMVGVFKIAVDMTASTVTV